MPNYAALKAEISLPKYAGMKDDQIAAALAAPVDVVRPFPLGAAITIASLSANFSWPRILQRARGTAELPPKTAADFAVMCAQNIGSQPASTMMDPANESAWATFLGGLTALEAVGDLSADDVAAIKNLATITTTLAATFGLETHHELEQEIAAARLWE